MLGETPEGQQYIETVPKRGYRFVAPVTENRDGGKPVASEQISDVQQGDALPAGAPAPTSPIPFRNWWLAGAGFLLVAILVSAAVIFGRPS